MPASRRIANKTSVTAGRKTAAKRKPAVQSEATAFAAWGRRFDAKLANLIERQDALLRSLGVEPFAPGAAEETVQDAA